MSRLALILLLIIASATAGAMASTVFFTYAARDAALEVVECIKNPEGCNLDPSDAPDFSQDDKIVPVRFPHRTEISL